MSQFGVNISIGLSSGHQWPNGKPIHSEALPDGSTRHTLEDGRKLTVGKPTQQLEYISTWVGAAEGETYSVVIGIIGLSAVPGFYEVWNYDINAMRSYAFRKTVSITQLDTGESYTAEDLEKVLQSR
ncbi:hypothetical protein [Polaromonas sp.]|uniref:hypothetical protein n=1 Tax=Polaromonas sp. TaxID=1869339 RepID=UPI0025F1D460|nr:hypothetical protein [Polaromonas sp.]